jgi:hypothetical protein
MNISALSMTLSSTLIQATGTNSISTSGFARFGKGERITVNKKGQTVVNGSGTDAGMTKCNIRKDSGEATHLKISIKGSFRGSAGWSRLRIEVYDKHGDIISAAEQKTDDYSDDAKAVIPKDLSKETAVYLPIKADVRIDKINIMGVGHGIFDDLTVVGISLVKKAE